MFCKLALKNIKKSFKDYAIYFFTLILGVAIFYVFNAIDSQTIMLDITSSTKEIIKLMTNMLSGVSVFISFILGFLVIYASMFLIKRRNKEFGIYLTLGMSKRKISLILFFETLFIGIISLAVGLLVGVLLSQFMSLLVANMFDANMTKFTFTFSYSACLKTMLYFSIMYVIVMIFNTIIINKCKLIDLLHGNKKSEKIKLKNPIICVLVFVISSIILGYAYWLVTGGFASLDTADKIFKPIIMGSIATFFIFWSLSGLILKIMMSLKKIYYKGLNCFTFRQFSSKINTTVFSMTIICLMLFITICVLSASLNVKNSLQANVEELAPADIELTKRINLDESSLEDGYTTLEIEESSYNIKESFTKLGLNINSYFKESVDINIYQTDDLTLNHTLGDKLEEIRNQYVFLKYETPEDIIKLSDYNKIAKLYGKKELSLEESEYIIVADFKSMVSVRNIALQEQQTINVFNHVLKPKYLECQDGFLEMSAQHINSGLIVVDDEIVDETYKTHNIIIANYNKNNETDKKEIEEKINKFIKDNDLSISINTKLDILEASIGLGALITFIGLYLGIIFLISSAAILALKELSESSDNKERFAMLRKIGTDEKMISKALFRQISIFFILPLFFALIHSIFGIMFSVKILEIFGNEELLPSIIMTAMFIVVIYGGYFILTYISSKNIIKER